VIYAQPVSIPADSVVEVFTEIGIDPLRCEVIVQFESPEVTGSVLFLAQDIDGTSVGPALDTEASSSGGAALPLSTSRFCTDKDPVYLKNSYGSAITVAVALTDHP
jgi:hypothetical protein